ncbi:ATP-binding protein [Flavihumibacter cheonanensis]|uniref:ATP-binding protein n=1 Tax=Flavihumibacter cheonanensis TaxID=1442385 RepID=UPI001EF88F53|nr:ATP-binding protein [Flavihumibacter cheonanensis]MCG7753008.1 ATP-binding protein [Flavihumibacter cheonanensis]
MQKIPTHPCDRELIQFQGKIQPHGATLVIDKNSLEVKQASSTINQFLPLTAGQVLGKSVQELLEYISFNCSFEHGSYQQIKSLAGDCYLISHQSADCILLEFEPVLNYAYSSEMIMADMLDSMSSSATVIQALEAAAQKVKMISGFHRVMVYMFHEDGHGEVVAEVADKGLDPYLGLHYPASDIPKQARELYKKNLVRLIADVNATDSLLEKSEADETSSSVDLSDSVLRSVSPTHIQYLKNMGVAASFSISIVSQGELWGLIACHHYTPRHIDYRQRLHAKMVGQMLSSIVRYQVEEEKQQLHHYWRENTAGLVRQMRQFESIAEGVSTGSLDLLSINGAKGAALIYDGQITLVGQTPGKEFLMELSEFLQTAPTNQVFQTNHLSSIYPAAGSAALTASGMLCAPLSTDLKDCILWFKPELEQEIKWAGNPEKAVVLNPDGKTRIEPRSSFAIFIQSLKGRSEKWTTAELSNAYKLREEILLLIQEKTNQLKRLNDELKKAYEELDSFSYTISHDLKTPLATIYNFAELLLEEDPNLDNRLLTEKIKRNAERMQLMIKEVFRYTKLGREQISLQPIDMKTLLNQIREDLLDAYKDAQPEFQIGDTPEIYGDSTMISQVFSNLLGNAIKYSSKTNKPMIQVTGSAEQDAILYTVADNGIGMDPRHTGNLFNLFYRLPGAKNYEGTGLGLAIVKRIIEKHQGQLWFETEQNKGTRFYIRLKKVEQLELV